MTLYLFTLLQTSLQKKSLNKLTEEEFEPAQLTEEEFERKETSTISIHRCFLKPYLLYFYRINFVGTYYGES